MALSALGGTRTHGLSLRRAALYPTELQARERDTARASNGIVVPKEGFEPTHPCGYYVLNVARLPFRHFGTDQSDPNSSHASEAPVVAIGHVGGRGFEPRTSRV